MKKQVNLYQPSCYPARPKWTFGQFILLLLLCCSLMVGAFFIGDYQSNALRAELSDKKQGVTEKQAQLAQLAAVLQKRKVPEEKLREHRQLLDEVAAKRRLLASIAGIDVQDLISFSALMRGLSEANMDNLSITHFSLSDGVLNISGHAKNGDSVPLWLSNMQRNEQLSTVAFKALSIQEARGYFTFQLSNSNLKGKTNE